MTSSILDTWTSGSCQPPDHSFGFYHQMWMLVCQFFGVFYPQISSLSHTLITQSDLIKTSEGVHNWLDNVYISWMLVIGMSRAWQKRAPCQAERTWETDSDKWSLLEQQLFALIFSLIRDKHYHFVSNCNYSNHWVVSEPYARSTWWVTWELIGIHVFHVPRGLHFELN